MNLHDFILPCLPALITNMKEEKSRWTTQIIGSIIIQLVTAAIIGTVIMYGTTERLAERLDRVEKHMDSMAVSLMDVQIEIAKQRGR